MLFLSERSPSMWRTGWCQLISCRWNKLTAVLCPYFFASRTARSRSLTISYWYALRHLCTSSSFASAGGSRMFQSLISNGCVPRIASRLALATWRQLH
jgi:hypothetical protein